MIKIHREGRLANQLFQFSFGYAASRQLNTRFYIEDSLVPQYFTVPGYAAPSLEELTAFHQAPKAVHLDEQNFLHPWFLENARKAMAINGNFAPFDPGIFEKPLSQDPLAILQEGLADSCLYLGFFQSERYFLPYREEIFNFLALKPEIIESAKSLTAELFTRPTVVIHIRRTDFLTFGFEKLGNCSLATPYSFFRDALNSIEKREQFNLIFISDDIDDVKREFSDLPHSYFPHHSEIIDFALMTFADINIISNSSYSWWGAYLNQTSNRQVIAPKHFLGLYIGEDFPRYVAVPEWTYIPVKQETAPL